MNTSLDRRARAAFWSRLWLVLSALVAWASFAFGPDLEGFIESILLTGLSVVEFKVYDLFRSEDLRAARIGWWNQCVFAALFVIYGVYHGTVVTISPMLQQLVDAALAAQGTDESMLQPSLHDDVQLCYYSIAVVGGAGQFWLACFYRRARNEAGA